MLGEYNFVGKFNLKMFYYFFLGGVLPKPMDSLTAAPVLQRSSSTSRLSTKLPSNIERARSFQHLQQQQRQQQQETSGLKMTTVRFVTPSGHQFKITPH